MLTGSGIPRMTAKDSRRNRDQIKQLFVCLFVCLFICLFHYVLFCHVGLFYYLEAKEITNSYLTVCTAVCISLSFLSTLLLIILYIPEKKILLNSNCILRNVYSVYKITYLT